MTNESIWWVLLLALLFACPSIGEAQESGDPLSLAEPQDAPVTVAPRFVEHQESIVPLWVAGVVVLPLAWAATLTAALLTAGDDCDIYCRSGDYVAFALIPVVGPWLMLDTSTELYPLSGTEIAAAVVSGIVQLASLASIVLGAALQRTVRVPLADGTRAPQVGFFAAPSGSGALLGLSLTHF